MREVRPATALEQMAGDGVFEVEHVSGGMRSWGAPVPRGDRADT